MRKVLAWVRLAVGFAGGVSLALIVLSAFGHTTLNF